MLSPLYGQLSPLRVPTKSGRSAVSDADAEAYLLAVEAADGQQLEKTVGDAINAFVVGCKSDAIWNAIKASCILAGARTLPGALVPLVGTAPTNNSFVTEDYNRKTGLIGDGSNKDLITNRNNNSDPQNSKHISVYATQTYGGNSRIYMGGSGGSGTSQLFISSSTLIRHILSSNSGPLLSTNFAGLIGTSRSNSTQVVSRGNGTSTTSSSTSQTPINQILRVFANGTGQNNSAGRIAFYYIGESIDLAALDTRVSTLMTALATALP
jgi:hypothetical protein